MPPSTQIQQFQLQPQQCKCIDFLKEMSLDSEYEILTYLTAKDLCACSRVSHRWNELADHPTLWQNICRLRWRTKKHKCFEQMELEDRNFRQSGQGESKSTTRSNSRLFDRLVDVLEERASMIDLFIH